MSADGPSPPPRAAQPARQRTGALLPVTPAAALRRTRLIERMESATRHRLVVVSAGPGWGKTTATASWAADARRAGRDVAWLTLEDHVDTAASFWAAVLSGVVDGLGLPAGHPLTTLSAAGGVTDEVWAAMMRGFAQLPRPGVLVLDDFHSISSSEVLDQLGALIASEVPLHLMVLTRSDPTLPLHRLRLFGTLDEIRAGELAFSSAETRRLAASAGIDLPDDVVEQVQNRTHGWPAGVRLALLHLSRHGPTAGLAGFAGTDRSVAEFLVAEVLAGSPAEVRSVLARVSVASELTGDLVEAIAPGGRGHAILDELAERGEFVTALGVSRDWFRIHPLLRDLLQHLLQRDDPSAFRAAHAAAARWLAENADPVAALEHAAAAREWDLVGDVFVAAAAPALVGGDPERLGRALESLPFTVMPDTASTHLCAAGAAIATGQLAGLPGHVRAARDALRPGPGPANAGGTALLSIMGCVAGRASGDADAVLASADAALAALRGVGAFPAADDYRALAEHNRNVGLLWAGRIAEARDGFEATSRTLGRRERGLTEVSARSHLALTRVIAGDVVAGLAAADEVIADAARRGWLSRIQLRPAHTARAIVYLLSGEVDQADLVVAEGLAADIGGSERAPTLALLAARVDAAAIRGHRRAAAQAAEATAALAVGFQAQGFLADVLTRARCEGALLQVDPARLRGLAQDPADGMHASRTWWASRARVLLASGDIDGARSAGLRGVEGGDWTTVSDLLAEVEARLVLAMVAARRHDRYAASAQLRRAVDVATPQRVLRPFLVADRAAVGTLITHLIETGGAPHHFASEIASRLGPASDTAEPDPLAEALTQRELSILAQLPTMRSNTEIAADFYISVNTVKAHLKALYRKLGVSSRRDAVRRGRELGLLP